MTTFKLPAILIAIFLLALAPRLFVAVRFNDPPALTNDAGWYDFFGQQIANGHGYALPYGEATSRWPPGYPFFLGAVYKATDESRAAARFTQAVLGALTAVLVAELARRLLSERTGIVAGVIVALLPGHVLWTSILMSEVLFTFLFMAAFVAGTRSQSKWSAAIAGLAFGGATLVRPQGLPLVIALFASWWAFGSWRQPLRRRTIVRAGVLMATLTLTLVPWTVRNAVQLKTFAPVSTNLGMVLWVGHNPDATGVTADPPTAEFDRKTADLSNPAKEVRFDALARRAALRYMARHPLTVITRMPRKVFETHRNDRSFGSWYQPAGTAYLDPELRLWIGRLTNATYLLLLAAACTGGAMLLRARAAGVVLPLVTALIWTAGSALLFGVTRYQVPLMPLLAIPAAYALIRAHDVIGVRLWRSDTATP